MFEATNQTTWWLTYPSEKYEFISWDDYPIYEMENNPAMFETTNQVITLTPGFLRLLYDVEHGFREAK